MPPLIGLYIYNLILGLLLVDLAINLHESSKCEVPSRSKDFADMATTSSGASARAVAFTGVYLRLLLNAHGQHINVPQHFVYVKASIQFANFLCRHIGSSE